MTAITVVFDYGSLSTGAADMARQAAGRIRGRIVGGYLATGHDLLEVKAQLGHGKFCAWLAAEFGMTVRTTARYMAAARFEIANSDIMSKLLPETIQALAAPSLSDEVRASCIERVQAGEILLPKHVKAVASEFRRLLGQSQVLQAKRLSRTNRKTENALIQKQLDRVLRRNKRDDEDKAHLVTLIIDALGARQQEALQLLRRLRGYDIHLLLEEALVRTTSSEADR